MYNNIYILFRNPCNTHYVSMRDVYYILHVGLNQPVYTENFTINNQYFLLQLRINIICELINYIYKFIIQKKKYLIIIK